MKFKDDLRHAISLFPKNPLIILKKKKKTIPFKKATNVLRLLLIHKQTFKNNGQMDISMNFLKKLV